MTEKKKNFIILISGFLLGLIISVYIFKVTDYKIRVSKNINRIISLAPNITETIIELKAMNKLVGRSDFCIDHLPKVKKIPTIGTTFTPLFEKILKLKPDIIFTQGKNAKIQNFCKANGIKLVYVNMDSIKSISAGIRKIGNVLNLRSRAGKLIKELNDFIVNLRKANLKAKKKNILLVVNRKINTIGNIFTVGKKSFLSEAIEITGARNLFRDSSLSYTTVSIESIIKRNPDIIIELVANKKVTFSLKQKMKKQWRVFSKINAVRNNKVFIISEKYVFVPGTSIMKTIKLFQKIIYEN